MLTRLKFITTAIVFLLAALLGGCSKSTSAGAAGGPPPAPVKVQVAKLKTLPVEIRGIGNVEAFKTISVKSQITGALMKVNFREGDPVKSGQLLFEIDPRPYQESIRQMEATLARDSALLRQSEATLQRDTAQEKFMRDQAKRYSDLAKEGVFSKEQSDQANSTAESQAALLAADRASIESARSAITADQATINNAKLQLAYCSIYSPIDGRTGNISVKEGNLVKATDIELVTIMQVNPVYVTFTVPERQLDAVRDRMRAGTLAVTAIPESGHDYTENGSLSFIDNLVDQKTGTIKLKATFKNQDTRLWPGRFVDVVLTLSQKPNVIAIPSRAVQVGQQGNFVFVLKSDQTVEMRTVTTGQSAGEFVEVTGVKVGESVVTEGHIRLAPGSRVKVLS